MLALLVACAGEDLSSNGVSGSQGGAGSSQAGAGGQAGGAPAGQGGTSGTSGHAGTGGSDTAGAGGAASGAAGAVAAGAGGGSGVGGPGGAGATGGPGGASGSSGQGGASTAGQAGSAGQVSSPCIPGSTCVRPTGTDGLCDQNGQCQPLVTDIGCADSTREGFANLDTFPDIAACSGAWTLPGLASSKTKCAKSGNSGPIPDGKGCNASDLCADKWHICGAAEEVVLKAKTSAPCSDALVGVDGAAVVFYATRQSGPQENDCGASGTNNVYGCGVGGAKKACKGLTAVVGVDKKPDYPGWSFDLSQTSNVSDSERVHVVKVSGQGGVLCCRDQ